jgi:hypothetical protein
MSKNREYEIKIRRVVGVTGDLLLHKLVSHWVTDCVHIHEEMYHQVSVNVRAD